MLAVSVPEFFSYRQRLPSRQPVGQFRRPNQAAQAEPCLWEVFNLVLSLGGTLSGEHGIGLVKKEYVGLEIEPETLELMRRVKQQFDPAGILNPGKFFPSWEEEL